MHGRWVTGWVDTLVDDWIQSQPVLFLCANVSTHLGCCRAVHGAQVNGSTLRSVPSLYVHVGRRLDPLPFLSIHCYSSTLYEAGERNDDARLR